MQIQDCFIRFFILHTSNCPLILEFYGNLKMKLPLHHRTMLLVSVVINITSFSRLTEENSEYWSQNQTQSGNIHSIILLTYPIRLFTLKEKKLFNSHRPSVFLFGEQDWLKEVSGSKYSSTNIYLCRYVHFQQDLFKKATQKGHILIYVTAKYKDTNRC